MFRVWCRWWHGGEFLRRSILGGGTLACSRCGATFLDLADAGLLPDLYVTVLRPGVSDLAVQPEFAPASIVVRQGSRERMVRIA